MDFLAIGEKIKELRKLMGLSQTELAKGICTQAQISKIEKGDVFPFASTLYLISQRLGVDVNYFFNIGTTPRLDYVQEVTRLLNKARRNIDYQGIKEIINSEENNPLFSQNRKNQQLLLWHKGICEYELNKNLTKAFILLDEAILLTHEKVWKEREIEIEICKGNIYFEEKELDAALDVYLPAKEHLELLPHVQDETIKSRVLYNTARTFTRLQHYKASNDACKEAIDWCLERDNLYLLGEFHYHIGYNYELQGDFSLAKTYMEKALIIFELQKVDKYIHFIKSKIKKW
ncbi:XRE family transcriptional regulator [Bacillus canaveralius]|uniref:XRE family transcriptional regulator n=1 Tax=Bacillus canaveralius TaxID=1403243 RepID=A0A2N5GQC8_9BACI|nr:helix-turn-helix domain-containing protein [Bacillus canaveralius]PLR85074.1 XRE family transcriptional regulator [Bacillus canaveralius]PLS00928.1 XRE family transcriptional regulator [Bacillus canaveralius]RSK54206.1 XRE family transcriptional regulator [Bacillus canaveralius]